MYYVWTLRRPSHSGNLPIDVQMGEDLNTYSISGAQSGNYTLSLTVYDKRLIIGGNGKLRHQEYSSYRIAGY